MKKIALLCAVAVCLAACHCERRTTGTPCRKASCQASASTQDANRTVTIVRTYLEKEPIKIQRRENTLDTETKALLQAHTMFTFANVDVSVEKNIINLKFKEPIHFAYNSDKIAASSNRNLEATANVLKKYPNNKVTVKGYTDSLGDPLYNIDLSQRRAQAVADALVARGVNAENVTAVGFGSANPIATNKTSAGRAQNRRVELQIEVK